MPASMHKWVLLLIEESFKHTDLRQQVIQLPSLFAPKLMIWTSLIPSLSLISLFLIRFALTFDDNYHDDYCNDFDARNKHC